MNFDLEKEKLDREISKFFKLSFGFAIVYSILVGVLVYLSLTQGLPWLKQFLELNGVHFPR